MPPADPAPRPLRRPARPDDRAAVRELLTRAELPDGGFAEPFGEGFVVLEENGSIVAAAGIEVYGEDGLLRSVVVDPTLRGTGLGRSLTEDRLAWAREHRLRAVYLLTTTADAFFAHLGFDRVERDSVPSSIRRSSEFAELCPDSAVVQVLQLTR